MSSRDLATVVKMQKAFIKELLDRLEGKEIKQPIELDFAKHSSFKIGGKLYTYGQVFMLLNDGYFKGLTLEQIVELAKKSIRLTDDNCNLRHILTELQEIVNDFKEDTWTTTVKNDFIDNILKIFEDKHLLDK